MVRATILGVILIHPVLFLAYFVFGAAFGAVDGWNADRAPVFGLDGGFMATSNLACGYLITCGIVPLVISVVGAGLGVGVHLFRTDKATFLKVIGWGLGGAFIAGVGTAGFFLCMIILHPASEPDTPGYREEMVVMAGVNGAFVGFVLGAICGIARARRVARRATGHKA